VKCKLLITSSNLCHWVLHVIGSNKEPILDIYVLRDFQWYKECHNPLNFDPWNRSLKFWESTGLPLSSHPCNPFALVASPKLGLRHDFTPSGSSMKPPIVSFQCFTLQLPQPLKHVHSIQSIVSCLRAKALLKHTSNELWNLDYNNIPL
jgi:hypothetical protein